MKKFLKLEGISWIKGAERSNMEASWILPLLIQFFLSILNRLCLEFTDFWIN